MIYLWYYFVAGIFINLAVLLYYQCKKKPVKCIHIPPLPSEVRWQKGEALLLKILKEEIEITYVPKTDDGEIDYGSMEADFGTCCVGLYAASAPVSYIQVAESSLDDVVDAYRRVRNYP